MKAVLFATGHAPLDRHRGFAALAELVPLELALFGGPHRHGSPPQAPPVPHRLVGQREIGRLAASGRYGAVVAGTGGRVALPAAWRGARSARTPFVFWGAFWRQPRTLAHGLAYPMMLHIYRHADALVSYGTHVSAYLAGKGARNIHVAPQAVDNGFWRLEARPPAAGSGPLRVLFVGRPTREKGLHVLRAAMELTPGAELTVVGEPPVTPEELRNFYGAADVLVVPSVATRSFIEPWGLVVNEAMNQNTTIIASDAVGAAAGGLVRDGETGLVVPSGDPTPLAAALRRLAADPALRARLATAAAREVLQFTPEAWAAGFARALEPLLAS
ncbi:MAG: hypothetical protein NVSMB51_00030 [Solirubrobacteraceae bacterium]